MAKMAYDFAEGKISHKKLLFELLLQLCFQ